MSFTSDARQYRSIDRVVHLVDSLFLLAV